MKFDDIEGAIGRTPLVELKYFRRQGVRIFAKLEGHNPTGSLKDRIAKYMLDRAEREGSLTKDKIILEPTSGNTGISLAMLAQRRGYKLTVVMPENISPEKTQLLEAFGVQIIYSPAERGVNGAIELAKEIVSKEPQYFMPYQYGNQANPQAHYETTGVEVINDLPDVDIFIAGLGTGGTLMGVGRRLKEYNPKVKVIAVVPHPGEQIVGLRSLEEGFIPPILDLSLLDGRIVVESKQAFEMTRELLHREGIFAGISSGAVLYSALKYAERLKEGKIVILLADGGWKYLSSQLWTRPYEEMEATVRRQIWW